MESTLTIADIMPKPQRLYDKNRAPKLVGQPTVAYFHVTGMNRTQLVRYLCVGYRPGPLRFIESQINQIE